jgi:hypothetical protein
MRLTIVPGPVATVHLARCGHAMRSKQSVTRLQGARATRMLEALEADPTFYASDGSGRLPKGYFRACRVCAPVLEVLDA